MKNRFLFLFVTGVLGIGQLQAGEESKSSPNLNCGLGDIRSEVLKYVNTARSQGRYCGKSYYPASAALQWNQELELASLRHSSEMANLNYFDHRSRNGNSFIDRIEKAGYSWSHVAENISAGRSRVFDAIRSWIQSPGHCANLMKRNFSEVGVACAWDGTSRYKYFWTMDLARPKHN